MFHHIKTIRYPNTSYSNNYLIILSRIKVDVKGSHLD